MYPNDSLFFSIVHREKKEPSSRNFGKKKKASELIAKMNSFKNSEGKLYKLTMQDFEQGYFPWLLVEGKNLYFTQN